MALAESLTASLKAKAREAGFDAVGVAAATRLPRDGAALAAWLSGNKEAGMAWMARDPEKRSDPEALLPGCRCVVVVAMNYWPGEEEAHPRHGRARVALYARGRDYHRVLGEKLEALREWLDAEAGSTSRSFVDTGPVLERAWAERAGIGWIGKNANLLTRERGSWLLLGEILTTAELVPDAGPHAEFCGTCTACLDACPTGAIEAPGVVNAHRCISYWTIEHRGPIPEERREGLADWIFGCDVCQTVCPWNVSFAESTPPAKLSRRDDLRDLDPIEILSLDETSFRARYSGTALMRATWRGMRRNACVVLGNTKDARALPALREALDDDDPVVREHAAWAIARMGL
ncbi:MAG TPA: tRNA epoxyqueuosine(34) reductase QueG [Candidatus Polarisedimenticolaceae bacterium]|nr:tRNA epoxyqueuosine(34) reductase QueG [Candidatus Polarisedimenticolaceae bacterium]